MSTLHPIDTTNRLGQTLAQWRQWQCEPPLKAEPTIDRALTRGQSNHSYLTAGNPQCVIRIDGEAPEKHGLNRAAEWRILSDAWRAGIAPKPVYQNSELGCLVCSYLETETTTATTQRPDQQEELEHIALLMQHIHRLPARHQRLDIGSRIDNYARSLATQDVAWSKPLQQLRPAVNTLLAKANSRPTRRVLCHNDLLAANRLWSNGALYAIDWEYSAMAPALYDIAVTLEGDKLSTTEADILLRAYLERAPDKHETECVALYRATYAYLEILWYAVTLSAEDQPEPLEPKIQELGNRVAALSKEVNNAE